ncbi:N-acetyltransferase [Pedobacter foliorum]|uniref:N-acetyltransferase n=1 Tax=Pedobacter foliorum TaxID=2739058 RepID=UPI001566FA6B|nr:N-acetyltransferase [Pedobacter foliorum]NRF37531.1 N-acetyltransferase [Pedobacter foliorum]
MYVVHRANNEKHSVLIKELEDQDWKKITKKQFAFDWKKLKGTYKIFKLSLDSEVLGLIALNIVEPEERIEIVLLASSTENTGKKKKFDRIAGTLIAFACKEAIRNYNWEFPCVSLIPKTEIRTHYIKKYGMLDGGRQLYLEDAPLHKIIKEYLS